MISLVKWVPVWIPFVRTNFHSDSQLLYLWITIYDEDIFESSCAEKPFRNYHINPLTSEPGLYLRVWRNVVNIMTGRFNGFLCVWSAAMGLTRQDRGVLNTLRPRLNRRPFADDIFKCIFLNENVLISIKISLKFIPKGPINNIPALVQVMAWRRPGDKPLTEPMVVRLLTHICVTRPQWVNCFPWAGFLSNKIGALMRNPIHSLMRCGFSSAPHGLT